MRRSVRIFPTFGSHNVYIFEDKKKSRFKIGLTSYELDKYRKSVCYKEFGPRSQNRLSVIYFWNVGDFFAAFFLEQTIVETMKRLGLERQSGDWFEVDRKTLAGVWDVIE